MLFDPIGRRFVANVGFVNLVIYVHIWVSVFSTIGVDDHHHHHFPYLPAFMSCASSVWPSIFPRLECFPAFVCKINYFVLLLMIIFLFQMLES